MTVAGKGPSCPDKDTDTMAAAGGESIEKLEDMIVRTAEATAANVRAA